MNPRIVPNITGKEECPFCLDDDWVLLGGTTRKGKGPTYERGCAPCRWCEHGERVMDWTMTPEGRRGVHVKLDTQYLLEEVVIPTREPATPAEKREAKEAFERAKLKIRGLARVDKRRHDEVDPPRVSAEVLRQRSRDVLASEGLDDAGNPVKGAA